MFNEQNSVENFVRDQLCAGDVGSRRREDNEGREDDEEREARRTRRSRATASIFAPFVLRVLLAPS